MFRVESQLELLTSADGRFAEANPITIRGYIKDEPVIPPAQFKDVKAVSVGDVVGFCGTHRDLVLRKRDRVKDQGAETWPRAAGKVIERVLGAAYDYHSASTNGALLSSSVDEIAKAAQARVAAYEEDSSGAKKLAALEKMVVDEGHFSNDSLKRLLVDSLSFDLFHQQGALNYKRRPESATTALNNLQMNPNWDPPDFIKLSKATPDFVIQKHRAIGDIKSGSWTDEYYLTATGYALAYESKYEIDIDLGVIYLVELEPVIFGQSRVVVFPITDDVRRRFLDRRNRALKALAEESDLPLRLTREHHPHFCDRCGLRKECFKRDGIDE